MRPEHIRKSADVKCVVGEQDRQSIKLKKKTRLESSSVMRVIDPPPYYTYKLISRKNLLTVNPADEFAGP